MKLDDLNLSPNTLSGLQDVNYTELTEQQEASLPELLEGKDAIVKGEPGSDTYTSFIIPALENMNKKEDERKGITTLILTPKSDGAREIDELLYSLGYHSDIKSASIDLDGDPEEQKALLADNVDILVANPGPLAALMREQRYIFRHLDLLIIDAADEMLSLNLEEKIGKIRKRLMCDPQTVIYSGKANEQVKELAVQFMEDFTSVGFDSHGPFSEPPTVDERLSQGYIYVPNRMKITTLMAHIDESPDDRYVIFCASKRGTDRLYRTLRKKQYKATSLHGKLSDEKRAQRFANFTNGDIQFLLIADIPAADLDLQQVKQVINYDVPNDPDEYRYRADLVGSGKATGIVSLVSKQDRSDINLLENKLGQAPVELPLPAEVKKKLEQRRKKKQASKKKSSKNKSKKRQNGQPKKSKKRQKQKSKDGMELPQPSFDKLSGGRGGNKEEEKSKSGVFGLIKKLFS